MLMFVASYRVHILKKLERSVFDLKLNIYICVLIST